MRRAAPFLLAAIVLGVLPVRTAHSGSLVPDGRAAVVTAAQGVAVVRPVGHERWTPLDTRSLLFPGDVLRTDARGANALELRLAAGGTLVAGPGAVVEFPSEGGVRLLRGDLEVKADAKTPVHVTATGGLSKDVSATSWLRATDAATKELAAEPKWLTGYRASTSEEWMGSLLATVDGKNVPLTVGYHKVTVEIRDQIARTTVEESFVNSTNATLEGVFSFPLPADASISGFGMWIGDELVEADLVEKQRAREIYEDILRRKKDPGLLEWEGGNLFKARVYPIQPSAEKRIRLRYTQVLPLEGDAYRYRYALRSELLRLHPLRELSMAVNVLSTAAIQDVASPTHPVTLRKTDHEAVVEFGAQQYVPERDFEVAVTVGRGEGLSAIAHRRGDDGFFLLLLAPPDAAGAGWQRDLVPEGDPLDLVLVADTSGSMDPAARQAQSTFLGALLAQLSAKDRFRLLTLDVEPRWILGEPTPATEENAAKALQALDARFSLGWTDLERGFDAVLSKAGPTTQVIYVGDGIPTSGVADPVATADRLKNKAKDTKATFHAVSTSSAYEKGVLDAIASIGGGSVRRGEQAPAASAKALLSEIARPGLKSLKVEIRGVPTAKVYPEVLPNVAMGEQQAVLGRFLPGGDAKTASVVVTGTLAGKPVQYTSSFAVPAAEEGNSFLPRLWARRHLDALLSQGQDPKTKAQIVEFSREYQIMTPYTSFLVLENDEDRAKYGVERTVKMRDAEQFFADARDKAALEIARQQMASAHRWRLDLRRRMRREIEGLGRELSLPAAVGWMEGLRSEAEGPWAGLVGGGGAGGEIRHLVDETKSLGAKRPGSRGGMYHGPSAAVPPGLREPSDPASAPKPSAAPMPAEAAEAAGRQFDAGDDDFSDAPAFDADEEGEALEKDVVGGKAKKVSEFARRRSSESDRESGISYEGRAFGEAQARADRRFDGRRPSGWDASAVGFPGLEGPPKALPTLPDPSWDPLALEALRALDRRPSLRAMDGALRIQSEWASVHPLRGRVEALRRATITLSAKRWHLVTEGFQQAPFGAWLSDTERGVVHEGLRLGRRRPAADADRGRWPIGLEDGSLGDAVRSYALAYRRAPKVTREGDLVHLVFPQDQDPAAELHLLVDSKRGVLVERRSVLDGKTTGTVRFGDFVEAAGRSWATKVETLDEDAHVVARQTLKIEVIQPAALQAVIDAIVASYRDVVFLGAEDPDLATSRQAVHDGRATFAHRLVVALDHGSRGRWDDLWKAWEPAETLVQGTPGASWMRLALLARSRSGVELKALAQRIAEKVLGPPSPFGAWRAAWLDGQAGGLGGQERLDLVDAVKEVWTRAGPDQEAWTTYALERHARAMDDVGDAYTARIERADIARKRPFDLRAVLAHASDLHAGEDVAGAAGALDERIGAGGPWSRGETDSLYRTSVAWLFEVRDLPRLEAAADAWVATRTRLEEAYRLQASALYFHGRYEDGDRWVREHLDAAVAPGEDPSVGAAREAAVNLALGQGWSFWAPRVPTEWRAPLAGLALRLARSDARSGDLVSRILGDWRFRQTEEARVLLETLRSDVTAGDAASTMPIPRLGRYVRLVDWGRGGVDDAGWRKTVDTMLARFRATLDPTDAEILAGLVRAVIDARGIPAEGIAFLRERLAKAAERDARAFAQDLFDALLRAPHETAREDEAFALLPRLLDRKDDAPANRARAAAAARRLASFVFEARQAGALGGPEERAKRTRAEAAQKAKDARTQARVETAARLFTAVGTADPILRPWLEVERLGYAAESLADLAKVEGEARELLEAIPPGSDADADVLLAERSALVLAYAATRSGAPAGLADRGVALLRARLAAKDLLLDDRYHLYRLLVALDRVDDLEKDLVAWIRPDDVDPTWRIALAYLQAETGRLREAATTLEGASALTELEAPAWAALSAWYLVLKEDARREQALDRRYRAMQTWDLKNLLWQEGARVSRNGDGVPAELDPEALRILRILLEKSENPGSELQHVLGIYRPTKDFRVLESLSDGVLGHSPEAVYGYLLAAAATVQEIHEEATCDRLVTRLGETLARAKTDTDRRAVRLLVSSVETRAGKVPKADPQHAGRALLALRAAFEGGFAPGERTLAARHLASLGAPTDALLAEEQMKRLEDLLAGATGGPLERLATGRFLCQALWDRNRRDDATDRLDDLLRWARESADGTLRPAATEPYDLLLRWWADLGRYRKVEDRLRTDLAREPRSGRRDRLRVRLFEVYAQALAHKGTLSFGSGEDLYRSATAETERFLVQGPAYLLPQVAQAHADLHKAAVDTKAVRDAGSEYELFVRKRLPAVLARAPLERLGVLQRVLPRLQEVAGPLAALGAALDLVEREPSWYERIGQDSWTAFAGSMAYWRSQAGRLEALEPRLLSLVLARLELALVAGSGEGGGFWWRGNRTFWSEHADEFATVAAKVAEVHADDVALVLRVAGYQRLGLELHGAAVATLEMALAHGKDPESLRSTLATWLVEDRRFAEAWPVAERLVAERPDTLRYRLLGGAALHGLGRDPEALALFEASAARWKERKAWTMDVAAELGTAALDAGLAKASAEWMDDALRLRREAGGGSGPDATLSAWYGTLARARSLLGDTDAAVRAASAAIVAWGRDQEQRAKALDALKTVLTQAHDLPAWVAAYDAQVATSGMDAPTLRKTLGLVLLERGSTDLAAAQLRAARDLDPADAETHALLVRVLDAKGDGPGALEALLTSVRIAPKNLDAYASLAQRFEASGAKDDAERARTNLVEAMPSEPDGYRALAKMRESTHGWALAVEPWTGVTRVRPLEPEGWLSLARAQIEAGDGVGARATIAHVLGTTWDPRFGDVKLEAARLADRLK